MDGNCSVIVVLPDGSLRLFLPDGTPSGCDSSPNADIFAGISARRVLADFPHHLLSTNPPHSAASDPAARPFTPLSTVSSDSILDPAKTYYLIAAAAGAPGDASSEAPQEPYFSSEALRSHDRDNGLLFSIDRRRVADGSDASPDSPLDGSRDASWTLHAAALSWQASGDDTISAESTQVNDFKPRLRGGSALVPSSAELPRRAARGCEVGALAAGDGGDSPTADPVAAWLDSDTESYTSRADVGTERVLESEQSQKKETAGFEPSANRASDWTRRIMEVAPQAMLQRSHSCTMVGATAATGAAAGVAATPAATPAAAAAAAAAAGAAASDWRSILAPQKLTRMPPTATLRRSHSSMAIGAISSAGASRSYNDSTSYSPWGDCSSGGVGGSSTCTGTSGRNQGRDSSSYSHWGDCSTGNGGNTNGMNQGWDGSSSYSPWGDYHCSCSSSGSWSNNTSWRNHGRISGSSYSSVVTEGHSSGRYSLDCGSDTNGCSRGRYSLRVDEDAIWLQQQQACSPLRLRQTRSDVADAATAIEDSTWEEDSALSVEMAVLCYSSNPRRASLDTLASTISTVCTPSTVSATSTVRTLSTVSALSAESSESAPPFTVQAASFTAQPQQSQPRFLKKQHSDTDLPPSLYGSSAAAPAAATCAQNGKCAKNGKAAKSGSCSTQVTPASSHTSTTGAGECATIGAAASAAAAASASASASAAAASASASAAAASDASGNASVAGGKGSAPQKHGMGFMRSVSGGVGRLNQWFLGGRALACATGNAAAAAAETC